MFSEKVINSNLLIKHILVLSWIEPNQGQNSSPWAWHCWTPGLVSEYLRHGIIDAVFLIFSFMLDMSYRQSLSHQSLLDIPEEPSLPWSHEHVSYQAGACKYVIYVIFSILILNSDTEAAPHADRRQHRIWHLRLKNISACGRIMFSFHSTFHVAVKSELRNVY